MSKQLLAQRLFKKMNIQLNVEVDTPPGGEKHMIIGGLTPKYKIMDDPNKKGGHLLIRMKWVGGAFKGMKPIPVSFSMALKYVVMDEVSEILGETTKGIMSGEIKPKPRKKVKSRFR